MRLLFLTFLLMITSFAYSQDDVFRRLQTAAIEAESGDTIYLPEGKFQFSRSFSIDGKKDIVVLGKGMDKTIISFKNQIEGAEGFKINQCENISLIGFTLQDAKGDCIKILNSQTLYMKDVKTEWTGRPSKKNGAYGIYPVNCHSVDIYSCAAIGASDAGIYVGQSHDVSVRNCFVKNNVAGIEIENCIVAVVSDNIVTENTGGILVFDLPELPLKHGKFVEVYNNKVFSNNYKNFAPKGNIVGEVPPGTGIMVMATEDVKVYKNSITNNRTASISVVSYYMTERSYNDKEYNAYPYNINIYDNNIEMSQKGPSKQTRLGLLVWIKFGKKVPAILYDGIIDKNKNAGGSAGNENKICVKNNTIETFSNLDAGNGFKGLNYDVEKFRCK